MTLIVTPLPQWVRQARRRGAGVSDRPGDRPQGLHGLQDGGLVLSGEDGGEGFFDTSNSPSVRPPGTSPDHNPIRGPPPWLQRLPCTEQALRPSIYPAEIRRSGGSPS
jgi:hypothetical protein